MSPVQNHVCWICGRTVALESCKSDEGGCSVLEDCYLTRLALATESTRLRNIPPPSSDCSG